MWTDGHLVASVGLDQRLRTWTALLKAAHDSPSDAAESASSVGVTAPSCSSAGSHGSAVETHAGELDKATPSWQISQQLASRERDADLKPAQDVRCRVGVRECESTVLQVLEPSALHVSPLPAPQGSWHIAVVGRGTQIVLCSAEGGL